jgi:hypothetical protein
MEDVGVERMPGLGRQRVLAPGDGPHVQQRVVAGQGLRVLLDGDPLEGYWNLLKTKVVVKGGRVVVDKR